MRRRSAEYSLRFFDGTDSIEIVRFHYLSVGREGYFQTRSQILRLSGSADVEHPQTELEERCCWRLLYVPQVLLRETQV